VRWRGRAPRPTHRAAQLLGRPASSYRHPGVDEVIDNCQHVLFGCCTNLIGFYRRIGRVDRIHWTRTMTMIEPGGRRSELGPSWLPAPLHGLPSLLRAKALRAKTRSSDARLFCVYAARRGGAAETWAHGCGRTGAQGAIDRFWRLVIASALNADVTRCAALCSPR